MFARMKQMRRESVWSVGSLLVGVFAMVIAIALVMPLKVCAGNVTSGTLGKNGGVKWSYDAYTKTLTMTGEDEDVYGDYAFDEGDFYWSPFHDIDVSYGIEKIVVKDCTIHGVVWGLFGKLSSLKEIEFRNFDTSNVTDMSYMFQGCSSLTSLDVSSFDTSEVYEMSYMFSECDSLTSLDVSSFNTSKVWNMNSMFSGCSSLTNIDVTGLDTSNVQYMYGMFSGCSSLTNLDVSDLDTNSVDKMDYMFSECSGLTSLDVSSFDTRNMSSMSYMFSGCSKLMSLDISDLDTSGVGDMSYMFSGCSSLTNLDLSSFDTSRLMNMDGMFSGCSSLVNLDLSGFDTGSVAYMSQMFEGCSSLTSLDLSNFDTSGVRDMDYMFSECSSLTNLDLSNFDTSYLIRMKYMFFGCSKLTSLNISSFKTSNVWYLDGMFEGCSLLCVLHTPAAMASTQSIDLPGEFHDSKGNVTNKLTAEFCKDVLTTQEINPFADVRYDMWYFKFVQEAYDRGIMAGTGKTADGLIKFDPEGKVTREQFVQILYNLEGKPAVEYQNIFPDVPEQSGYVWYSNAIMWAVESGIVSGYANGKFGVGDPITREQVALMLLKYANFKGYDTSKRADVTELQENFLDVSDIHDWALDGMCWAVANGVMKGTAGGKLMPLGNATRAEAATMFLNMLKAYGE